MSWKLKYRCKTIQNIEGISIINYPKSGYILTNYSVIIAIFAIKILINAKQIQEDYGYAKDCGHHISRGNGPADAGAGAADDRRAGAGGDGLADICANGKGGQGVARGRQYTVYGDEQRLRVSSADV